jgi:CheY-like chemotaxis protein
MSLSGRLEDLQLRDLLQILCLGHNDGLLQLWNDCDQAELVFREGLVISAWRQMTAPPRVLAQDSRYSARRFAIVALVQDLLLWDEGDFTFQAGTLAETLQHIACGEHVCLDNGLNVAELSHEEPLVLPASNGILALPAMSDTQDAVGDPSCFPPQDEPAAVLLVDDHPQIAALLVQALAQQGLVARSFGSGGELLRSVRSAWEAGQNPLLIIDLVMPRLHGGGILGGLELVEQVRSLRADQACLVYSDYSCPEVGQRLQQLGVNELLSKPQQQSPAAADHSAAEFNFCNNLALKVAALFGNSSTPLTAQASAETSSTPSSVEPAMEQAMAVQGAGMGVLKGMLQELQAVESENQIMLLVLRFATEILSRAVLFSVDRDRIVGLGQFGYGDAEFCADDKVRRIIVPLTEPSSFKEVFEQVAAYCGPLGEGYWDTYLRQELGLCAGGEVFIGSLLSDGKVVALLCGDNQKNCCGIEDSQTLEIFLQQAGVALEKLHMTDKLINLSALLEKTLGCQGRP